MRFLRIVLLPMLLLTPRRSAADVGFVVPGVAEVAPPLAVARDAERPRRRTAVWVDALGVVRGEYRVAVLRSFAPRHAVAFVPSFVLAHGARGGGADLTYSAFFLGRGVEGPFVTLVVGGRATSAERGVWLHAGGELGYAHVLAGIVLGASFSAVAERSWQPDGHVVPVLRVRIHLGYAFF